MIVVLAGNASGPPCPPPPVLVTTCPIVNSSATFFLNVALPEALPPVIALSRKMSLVATPTTRVSAGIFVPDTFCPFTTPVPEQL